MNKLNTLLIVSLLAMPAVANDKKQCIQSAQRNKACPQLLYRATQLPSMSKPAVLCICVSDFSTLLSTPDSEKARILQQMEKRKLEAQFGAADLQAILTLLNRQ